MECVICTLKKHGMYTSPCGHQFCGKCFLKLHSEASFSIGMYIDSSKKSKCPFCRQVLGFENDNYYKLRFSHNEIQRLNEKLTRVREDVRRSTRVLQNLTRWSHRMRKINTTLKIEMLN
jgi:hypothetical protein